MCVNFSHDFHTDAVAFSNAHFGAGIGSQFLDEVSCTGSESMLISCSSSSSISCSNYHNGDAGVRCQSQSKHEPFVIILCDIETCFHQTSQLDPLAPTVMFVLLMVATSMRVEWRCASMMNGEQCVTIHGALLTPPLSANSWDMPTLQVGLMNIL